MVVNMYGNRVHILCKDESSSSNEHYSQFTLKTLHSTYILNKSEITVNVVRFTSVQSFDSHVNELKCKEKEHIGTILIIFLLGFLVLNDYHNINEQYLSLDIFTTVI